MKIVSINGSSTGSKGVTGQTLQGVIKGAIESGANVESFVLADMEINHCRACKTCQKTGKCVINDDYPKIQDALLKADGVILASPNYIRNVSSLMKAFLDRGFSLLFHCQAMAGKYGAVVVASAGPQYQPVVDYMMHITGTMGNWKVGSVVAASAMMDDADTRKELIDETMELGRNLAEAIKTKKPFPEQKKEREETFEIMRWLVETIKDSAPFEYEYWQKNHV
ncbi:flavodoxin family protein [Spirochaetota bacterium]